MLFLKCVSHLQQSLRVLSGILIVEAIFYGAWGKLFVLLRKILLGIFLFALSIFCF